MVKSHIYIYVYIYTHMHRCGGTLSWSCKISACEGFSLSDARMWSTAIIFLPQNLSEQEKNKDEAKTPVLSHDQEQAEKREELQTYYWIARGKPTTTEQSQPQANKENTETQTCEPIMTGPISPRPEIWGRLEQGGTTITIRTDPSARTNAGVENKELSLSLSLFLSRSLNLFLLELVLQAYLFCRQ